MDSLTQIRLTRELIDIDSTTGREAEAGEFIARTLEALGYDVIRQPVADGRFNVLASIAGAGAPDVAFSTHFDCVPPFFPSRIEDNPGSKDPGLHSNDPGLHSNDPGLHSNDPGLHGARGLQTPGGDGPNGARGLPPSREASADHHSLGEGGQTPGARLHGRGACDAKGTLIAQIAAAERLRAAGDTRVGLVFVVGEERGSDGAKAANTLAWGSKFLINGEPTDNRLGAATRGVYRARLRATGRAAHSSLPDLGISAIDKLVDAIVKLRSVKWPEDPVLGRTFYSVGLINGGVAPNVISPEADAELMFRTVGDHAELRTAIEASVSHLVAVEEILHVPPVRLTTVPDMETAVFSFTTDIPFLNHWGAPVLAGPGSVTLAHTADEYCDVSELLRAVDVYVEIARALIDR